MLSYGKINIFHFRRDTMKSDMHQGTEQERIEQLKENLEEAERKFQQATERIYRCLQDHRTYKMYYEREKDRYEYAEAAYNAAKKAYEEALHNA